MTSGCVPDAVPTASVAALFRRELAEEFRRDPLGDHGGDLMRLLSFMRGEPLAGKYVLLVVEPHQEWVLGRLSGGRGQPIEVLERYRFTSIAEAEWAVFKLRWKRWTAEELE